MNIHDVTDNFRDIFGLSVEISQKTGSEAAEDFSVDKRSIEEVNQQYL
jgi:hypothetical protein